MADYYTTRIVVDVLSKGSYNPETLEQVAQEMLNGTVSASWEVDAIRKLEPYEVPLELANQGSDPNFLFLGSDNEVTKERFEMLEWLDKYSACPDGKEWAWEFAESLEHMWDELCKSRPDDWLIWVFGVPGLFSDKERAKYAMHVINYPPFVDAVTLWSE